MSKSGTDDAIAIAHILRTQGRKGEVLAELLTDQPAHFEAGRTVVLVNPAKPQSFATEATLEGYWMPMGKSAGRIVLKLKGVDSISQAESLAGMDVTISRAELPELAVDTFYVKDLLGCTLLDGERVVGEVVDVQFVTSTDGRARLQDAAPLLAVKQSNGADEPVLVPLVRAYLANVDLGARRIVMNLPPGLLDDQDDQSPDEAPEGPNAGEA